VTRTAVGHDLDGSTVPLGSIATHELIGIFESLWVRWKPLEATMKTRVIIGMIL